MPFTPKSNRWLLPVLALSGWVVAVVGEKIPLGVKELSTLLCQLLVNRSKDRESRNGGISDPARQKKAKNAAARIRRNKATHRPTKPIQLELGFP